MQLMPDKSQTRRALGSIFLISLVMAMLLTAFFHTQVLSHETYRVRSEENRLRPITIPAPRGTITDRWGEIVATSNPGFSVSLLPAPAPQIEAVLRRLQPFLGLSDGDVVRLLAKRNARPHDLLEVEANATFAQVASIEERRSSFPGLLVVDQPKRYYPAGDAIGHMIGYVAEISREELEQQRFREAGYRQGRLIGKAGIEREYEMLLSGEDGARLVEVDAMGRIVNPRSEIGIQPPTGGEDVRLTLDLGLQKYVADIFPDSMKGALVAMVPSTGEVLALYSSPSYDPNDFVGGIPPRVWRALDQDALKPLLHRAVAARYPPASTFKLATAVMGLQKDIVTGSTRMPVSCVGGMAYAGRYARCWYRAGHGSQDLIGAIEKSCNVYFFQVGIRVGVEEFFQRGTRMGFAGRTGIDLPGEQPGEFPTGLDWYRKRNVYLAPSDILSFAIGQGANAQTPLKMAHFYSALAGNGRAPAPYLVVTDSAGKGPGAIDLGLTEDDLRAVWAGLGRVVNPGGTAWLSSLERWKVYGKTGTAQNPHGADHGWFAGFAGIPGERPEIAVAVIIEHGLHGSDVAPVATKAMNYYLNKKHGLPFDPQPILLERWDAGRCLWGQTCTAQSREASLFPGTLTWGPRGRFPYPRLERSQGGDG